MSKISNRQLNTPFEKTINFIVKGNVLGNRINTEIPFNANGFIKEWILYSPNNSTCVLNIKKNGSSICGGNFPSLTNNQLNSDSTLTGWSKSVIKNDIFFVEVSSTTGEDLLLQLIVKLT